MNTEPNINRKLPAYMPHSDAELITWLQQFLNAFGPIYPVIGVTSSTDYVQLTVDFVTIRNAYYSAVYAKGISEALTKFKNLAIYDRNQLPVTAPKQEGNLFPNADIAAGGFIWRVVDIINQNLASPKCTEDIQRQLQLIPPAKTSPDLLNLSPDLYPPIFTGGEVILKGHLPKPARCWHIYVDRNDGHGQVEGGVSVQAKFTDHHELPSKPTTWTYTVELRDADDIALGKVSVASVTVWKGSADHGPEAGSR